MIKNPSIFIHFFNPEILRAYHVNLNAQKDVLAKYVKLTKFSYLLTDNPLLAPVSSIFENPVFKNYLQRIKPLIETDNFRYISPTPNIEKYADKKIREFHDNPELYPTYNEENLERFLIHLEGIKWQPRIKFSASKTITNSWIDELHEDGIWRKLIETNIKDFRSINQPEQIIQNIPYSLDGKGFIYKNIYHLIPLDLSIQNTTEINFMINRGWIESYLKEYNGCIISDTPFGILDFGLNNKENKISKISYAKFIMSLNVAGLSDLLNDEEISFMDLILLKLNNSNLKSLFYNFYVDFVRNNLELVLYKLRTPEFQNEKKKILKLEKDINLRIEHLINLTFDTIKTKSEDIQTNKTTIMDKNKSNKIFLVHGRDIKEKNSLTTYLKTINIEIIEWEQAVVMTGNPSATTLDIIKAGFNNAQAVLVLFTPDEEVKLRDELLSDAKREKGFQPRPNVIFEAGLAFATHPNRTILISMGSDIRPVSDISGINFVRFDHSHGAKNAIKSRLELAGCTTKGI